MDASTRSLKQIFEPDRRYLVPLFQRPYVWGEESQWAPLWEDVRGVAERLASGRDAKPHFLGAIVLDHVRQPFGNIEARLIVDGQQRLTTLQLLLEAASDLCRERGYERYSRAFVKLTRNEDPLSDNPDDVFKVWPTNIDRDAFRAVMEAHSPESLLANDPRNRAGERPIARGYAFFSRAIREWLDSEPGGAEARIGHLHGALREYLRLVVIDLSEADDPQLIFETLNARGTPLLPADLVKNHLFHLAQRGGERPEVLYARYWRPIDDEAAYWREEIAAGRIRRSRIDLFLQHYVTMRTGEEVHVAHMYAAFQAFVRTFDDTPGEHLDSLSRYARIFRSFDEFERTTPLGQFFTRLQDLEVTTVYPLFLFLFAIQDLPLTAREQVATDVESFLVRRMVCRLTTKNYNRMFLDCLNAVRKAEPGAAANTVRAFLLGAGGDSGRWPGDAEFRDAWLEMPVYKSLVRRRVRLLLESLEQGMRGPMTEAAALPRKLTIEHLLPQEWAEHWPLPTEQTGIEARTTRDRLVHTIGNLTLLTSSLNPAISNGPWPHKRASIHNHSVLLLNRAVTAYESWDESVIRARSLTLFQTARRLWPQPDAARAAPLAVSHVPYAQVGREIVEQERAVEVSPEGQAKRVRCPIAGCEFLFERWPMGWDGHVGSVTEHPRWIPEVTDPDKRRETFRKDFAGFLGTAGSVASDRATWEARTIPSSLGVFDTLTDLLNGVGPNLRITYNRTHIAMGGRRQNFAWFRPRRTMPHCYIEIRCRPQDVESTMLRLSDAGFEPKLTGATVFRVLVRPGDLVKHRDALLGLLGHSRSTIGEGE